MSPVPPQRPDPTKAEEEDGGPPLGKAVLIGAPFVAAFGAAATWVPGLLMVGMVVFMFGVLSWCVGLLVLLMIEWGGHRP